MDLHLRPGVPEDAAACGAICYEAFKAVAEQHRFMPSYASVEVAQTLMAQRLAHPKHYVVVAERGGRVVGSNVLDERSPILGLGPITVDPAAQDRSIGRQLMQHVLSRADAHAAPGVRLVHAAYHTRAMCLYAKMGFAVREPLAKVEGEPLGLSFPGYAVRPASMADLDACAQLCADVHGHDRRGELYDAITQGTATVVEHAGDLSAYATLIGVSGHAVARTTAALQALIGGAPAFARGGFIIPLRNEELFSWCLHHGLRVAVPQMLMSRGFYQAPAGVFLPSVLY